MRLQVVRKRVELPDRGVTLGTLDFGGDGPLALLAHANGFCGGLFGLIAPALRQEFRVVAFDSRGHGDSSRPPLDAYDWGEFVLDLLALAEHLCAELGFPRIDYGIGHSFGGTAMVTAANERPELFGRLALLDPVVMPPAVEHPAEIARRRNFMADIARRRRQVWRSRDEIRAAWQGRDAFADWDPRALDLYIEEGFREREDGQIELKCPGEVEAAIFEASPGFDLFARTKNARTPGLLLHGGEGHLPAELHARLAASLSLEMESVPAGHLMLMTAPDEIAQRLLAFAARTPLALAG